MEGKRSGSIAGSSECEHARYACSKRHRPAMSGKRWLFSAAGVLSLIWFLIRVIPKPSRAAYPCQRVAAPLAASFVVWLTGLAGTMIAYQRWKAATRQARRWAPIVCGALAVAAAVLTVCNSPSRLVASGTYPPAHAPVGVAKGIYPGRVAWVHNPGATNWAGYNSSEHWFDDAHTNPDIVERMVSQAIRAIAGESDDAAAWNAIFHDFNRTHGRGDRGYLPGEKIMIKVNLGTCNDSDSSYNKNPLYINQGDVSPQIMRGLLSQLVYVVGVSQSDISIGDPSRPFVNHMYIPVHEDFRNVKYIDSRGVSGRTLATYSYGTPFYWSTTVANGKTQDYVPAAYAQADYFINLAMLKGHSSGISVCGKNNYGSLRRHPDAAGYYSLHLSLPNPGWSPGTGRYRAMVDLMGHSQLGGKTLLCLVDGLYAGYYWEGRPYKWVSPPFGDGVSGDWPSSIFASQDPVAIDSVCHDFLYMEWPNIVTGGVGSPGSLLGGAEDYLHEEALANDPPSRTFYDPERDGTRMASLGVHEHWNDSLHKQYSRDRGLSNGIELVELNGDSGAVARAKEKRDDLKSVIAGAVVTAAFPGYFYVEADDRSNGICVVGDHNLSMGMRANAVGLTKTNENTMERYIDANIHISRAGTGDVTPIAMSGNAVGGINWKYNPDDGAGQNGIAGSVGANNIGLLIRTAGHFRYISSTSFGVKDGNGREIICFVPTTGVTISHGWTHVGVTGVSSCALANGQIQSCLLVRSQNDITPY